MALSITNISVSGGDFNCFLMLKNTNNINYIHSTDSLCSQVSGAHIQVELVI